jgi:hypothetical protein
MRTTLGVIALGALSGLSAVSAHIALWDEGMYG